MIQSLSGDSIISDNSVLSPDEETALDATFQQLAHRHGYIPNLMQTLALAPHGLAAFVALSNYTCYGSYLTERQRQLATIIGLRDVQYGWIHQEPLALAAGVTPEQLVLIHDGRVPKDLPPAERALCGYALEITAGRQLPQRVAEDVQSNFSSRQIVDIALLTAYSMALSALATGLEVPIEPPETLEFERAWQQQRIATETG